MTQRPIGQVALRTSKARRMSGSCTKIFTRGVCTRSLPPCAEKARPLASGEDGVRSLATALAVLEASRSGRRVEIKYQ